MKKSLFSFITLFFLSLSVHANSNADTILGEWLSQDKDGKIIIFKQGDQYFGKISWGKTPGRKDTKNPDEKLRSRDLLGAVILKNFKFSKLRISCSSDLYRRMFGANLYSIHSTFQHKPNFKHRWYRDWETCAIS